MEEKSYFKILIGIPTGKRPSGRPRRTWEDNIRMDLKEISIRRIRLIQFRIGIIGESLCIRIEPPGFTSYEVSYTVILNMI